MDLRLDGSSPRPIAVALSGGGDSVALLVATVAYARQVRRRVVAITVDHQLSPDSVRWTALAKANAVALGADWRGCFWTGDKPSTGLPAAARQARHRLIADLARDEGARVVLFGHTADDVIEAADMRASDTPCLGSPKVWSPSPAWPEGRDVALFRPMLSTRRQSLREWLRRARLEWVEDPGNLDPRFARSRARLRLRDRDEVHLPSESLTRSELDDLARRIEFSKWGDARLRLDDLRSVNMDVAQQALSALLICVSGAEHIPRSGRVSRLLVRLRGGGPVAATLSGAHIVSDGSWVRIVREVGDHRSVRRTSPDVFDGRFESSAAAKLQSLKGQMRHLSPEDRRRLQEIPPIVRPGLPVWRDQDDFLRLATDVAEGGASVRSLARARFRSACGLAQREKELDDL